MSSFERKNVWDEPPSFLFFSVGDAEYAIEVETTEGVVDCPLISPLPDSPDGIIGVGSVRGRMTVVLDLSRGQGQTLAGRKRRLVLIKGDTRLGLLADRVRGVEAVDKRALREVAQADAGDWYAKAYLVRDQSRIDVLDVERLVAD
jgi:purine-binding chemotaxis protein CheW